MTTIIGKKQFERIVRHLESSPEGMTSGEIIERLHIPTSVKALSARMGKMFFYGKIDRLVVRHATGGGHVTRWKTKKPLLGDRTELAAIKTLS